ncbi:MAG: ribonucleoside-diphosphate reductase alpha chain, partial [Kribbellaceae bacterium]|nr:ribonucleoside-diphosphate reductase alpha chain [Kribbellaceae bacterium]
MTETVTGHSGSTKRSTAGFRGRKNAPAGLTIERIFTSEGIHPYDEVTWERRDVVQQNWRTGETVFEQRGVEFPDYWSVNASTIVTSKYFRGAVGHDNREWSLKQLLDRVVKTYRASGEENGYFATPADAEVFEHELAWMLLHQYFSFNSPVWFNVGTSSPQQVSACFILAVDDSMDSILNWYKEEGLIFKGGSGAGLNLSRIRSSKELLQSSGGTASGPVSFMRGADASAGTIKSGGATRRAAKMVVLDVDHPDIEEFVETKMREEDKIRVLRDAGYDMDLGGRDITSVQYQNANNSVRVTDDFMRAVEQKDSFGLRARIDNSVIETVDARELFDKISQAAWACADPGIQYDDTINDWHTTPETGRITASNPCCFVGETLVQTDQGPIAFDLLTKKVEAGDEVRVLTHAVDRGGRPTEYQRVSRAWVAGETNKVVEVVTSNGLHLRCTPEHRFLADGEWIEAARLRSGQVLVSESGSVTVIGVQSVELEESVNVYDLEVPGTRNFVVADEGVSGVVVHNSEYMHLDNSSCNLASLNLMKFLKDDDTFDSENFVKAVELIITAMDISICFADFPTQAIGDTTRAYRQLGIGYANLGALLMATGHAYDSDGGRALAGAITSLMTGTSYKRSAELAGIVGPYDGFARNKDAHTRVMRKHAAANDAIRTVHQIDKDVQQYAAAAWDGVLKTGAKNGWRNAQASVLAPTGCLTPDTLVTTDRGLARLGELGDVWGDRWQNLDLMVSTDDGPRQATQFFVNGEEPTRRVLTEGGYRIQGTLAHRIKVVDPETGAWVWKRMAD